MATKKKDADKTDSPSASAKATKPKKPVRRDGDRDVGHALRTVYQKTVDESVPQEMLDLLGKLG